MKAAIFWVTTLAFCSLAYAGGGGGGGYCSGLPIFLARQCKVKQFSKFDEKLFATFTVHDKERLRELLIPGIIFSSFACVRGGSHGVITRPPNSSCPVFPYNRETFSIFNFVNSDASINDPVPRVMNAIIEFFPSKALIVVDTMINSKFERKKFLLAEAQCESNGLNPN